ncbi:MAG: M15 family metallopeptidase [Hyphomicrobium sp.]
MPRVVQLPEPAAAPRPPVGALLLAIALLLAAAHGALAAPDNRQAALERLLAAYPEQLDRIEGGELLWRDGSRSPLDDGKNGKSFEQWLNDPDIDDMLAIPYPAGAAATPPAENVDPGRARNASFFDRIYGDCRKGEVEKNLAGVAWLPKRTQQRLRFSKVNGAARALAAVSAELDALPPGFDVFLYPSAGTYNCRVIAGTGRVSAHGYGIAIDIAVKRAHYWRDAAQRAGAPVAYRNEVPAEIVDVFERHGFIWGGRWYHYDTMHFEYRPELLGYRPDAPRRMREP